MFPMFTVCWAVVFLLDHHGPIRPLQVNWDKVLNRVALSNTQWHEHATLPFA